jgi:hypothetical protein
VTVSVALAGVLVAGGLGYLAWSPGGEGSKPKRPNPVRTSAADPLAVVIPRPAQVRVTRQAGALQVTWTNPSPQPDDTYRVWLFSPDQPQPISVETTTATVPDPDGLGCVNVALVRDGRTSMTAFGCASGATAVSPPVPADQPGAADRSPTG